MAETTHDAGNNPHPSSPSPSPTTKVNDLGFVVTTSGENQSQQSEENESSQIKKKRARTDSSISNSNSNNHDAHRKQSQTKRGLMWDGKYKSIPHVQDATLPCSNLEELDLLCQSLDLSLCRVLRVWDIRSTKRTNKLMLSSEKNDGEGGSNNAEVARGGIVQAAWNAISPKRRQTAESDAEVVHHPSRAMSPYCEFHEDDGPLNTIYKRVFSIELAQIIENDDTATDSSITNMATAAFHDGKERLDREKARKQRHSIRKIRVFFYNRFADVMAGAFYALKKESLQKKKNIPFLMALTNIPAECIMPLAMGSTPHLQQYIMNPIGDDEYGVSSPFCICVGDKSSIRYDGPKLCFDHEELEMRLVEAPVNIPLAVIDNEGNSDFVLDDAIITSESIKYGNGYCMEGEQSNLVKKYVQIRKSKSDGPVLFNLEEEEEEVEELPRADTTVPNPPGLAGLRGSGGTATNNGGGESRATGESTAEGGDLIVRPKTVASLSDLQTLLIRNNMQKLTNRINVYGVVLGFSPPSLTRSEEWMMSIVLIDETIPLSNQIETRGQPNTNEGGETSNPKEMHVPSITLMIFSKDKSKLPVVRAAGDVICCEKVILQAWNGDAQLCARTHRGSNIIVVNPAQPRRPGDEIQNLPSSLNDWSASPSSGVTNSIRHLPLVNSLWRWGQQRLSSHPTMSPNCYLSIAGVGGDDSENIEVSASGDLTAVVTAIIPTPQHLRRRDTPRGYIRLWDGTGPSRSDPLPPIEGLSSNQSPSDPPEQVLVEIEKIISSSSSLGADDAIQAPITLCGRVINATIWEENLWNLIERENVISVGSFFRLRNVNKSKLPTWTTNCLSVHAKSSLTPLPFDAYEVKRLLIGHDSRVKSGAQPNPTSAILPSSSNNSTSRPEVAAQQMRNNGLSTIGDCLRTAPPASFTLQFEVSCTIPECNATSIDAMKVLCTRKNEACSFRFAMRVKDSKKEMDILCLGQVAEQVLGVSAQDIHDERQDKCHEAMNNLRELMSPGSVCEGKVRNIIGKDGKLYFILKSMFCITAEDV